MDLRYISHLDVNWAQISEIVGRLSDSVKGRVKVGFLNFNSSEVSQWQQSLHNAESVTISLEHASKDISWEVLYPEWIDEEEESEVPVCRSLPEPKVPKKLQLDLVVVKLPCRRRSSNWSRDIARLHLQLAAAKLATSTKGHAVYVLFVTECFPIPNLFTCKELVVHEENVWLYKPNLRAMREKLRLPVGSCELAVPLKAKGSPIFSFFPLHITI